MSEKLEEMLEEMSSPAPDTGRPVWMKLAWLAATAAAIGMLALLLSIAVLYPQLPDTRGLAHYQPKQPLRVYTADGV